MKRICFINNAGGCGKTTTLFNVAGELASQNQKVLVVDMDRQTDSTYFLLADDQSEFDSKYSKTIIDLLNRKTDFNNVVKKNYIQKSGDRKAKYYGIDVIPGSADCDNLNEMNLKNCKEILDMVEELYDYCLIDCPPSNKAAEKIVLEDFATHVIVPITADTKNIRGYASLIEKVNNARKSNINLTMIGMFFSRYRKQRKIDRGYRELMINSFSELFIDVQIPDSSAVIDGIENTGQPMAYYHKNNAAESFRELTNIIIAKCR